MFIHFDILDSTSTYIKNNYEKMEHLSFVDASFQTLGRGRMNRIWYGDSSSLMFSYLIKEKELMKNFSSISILAAVSVMKVLERIGIKNISLKWPNDVFVDGKKIAGILLEGVSYSNSLDCVVVGVGINVRQLHFCAEIEQTATSIIKEGIDISVNKVKEIVYSQIIEDINNLIKNPTHYLEYARSHNFLKNKTVFADILGEKHQIKVLDINEDNSLSYEFNGSIGKLFSTEVTFH